VKQNGFSAPYRKNGRTATSPRQTNPRRFPPPTLGGEPQTRNRLLGVIIFAQIHATCDTRDRGKKSPRGKSQEGSCRGKLLCTRKNALDCFLINFRLAQVNDVRRVETFFFTITRNDSLRVEKKRQKVERKFFHRWLKKCNSGFPLVCIKQRSPSIS